jgi:hypothetical protein
VLAVETQTTDTTAEKMQVAGADQHGREVITLALFLGSCSRMGSPPPGWFDEPISQAYYCDAESAPAPGPGSGSRPAAKRSPASIAEGLRPTYAEVDACYRELLSRNGDAVGTLDVRLLIAPNGDVRVACVVAATLNDGPTAACVVAAFERGRFNAASGYEFVRVPLRFELKTPYWLADFPGDPESPRTTEDDPSFGPATISR